MNNNYIAIAAIVVGAVAFLRLVTALCWRSGRKAGVAGAFEALEALESAKRDLQYRESSLDFARHREERAADKARREGHGARRSEFTWEHRSQVEREAFEAAEELKRAIERVAEARAAVETANSALNALR